jgi:hypothetical protein
MGVYPPNPEDNAARHQLCLCNMPLFLGLCSAALYTSNHNPIGKRVLFCAILLMVFKSPIKNYCAPISPNRL